jgi:phosphoglycolate phosphatase
VKGLVIFDLDGTLVDSLGESWQLFQEINQEHPWTGIRTKEEFVRIYDSNFYKWMFRQAKMPKRELFKLIRIFLKKFSKEYHPKVFPAIKPVVRELGKSHELAVLSSNFRGPIKRTLKRGGILKYFDCVIGAEDALSKVKGMKKCIKKLRFKPSEAVYVCDTAGDIGEARKAGIRSIAVTWGFHPAAKLKAARPWKIVRTPSQLLRVLQNG